MWTGLKPEKQEKWPMNYAKIRGDLIPRKATNDIQHITLLETDKASVANQVFASEQSMNLTHVRHTKCSRIQKQTVLDEKKMRV